MLHDIPPELFREQGERLVAWIAEYLRDPEQHRVLPAIRPGEIRNALPSAPPNDAEPLAEILADFERIIVPGMTHWNHPGFFAYFAVSAAAPGILGEMLAAALNVNAMLWKTSPAATELEQLALDWLRQMMGLGAGWFGMITDTASTSSLLALTAAREWPAELAIRRRGMAGRADLPTLRVYASEHAHSSIDKAVITIGLGEENLVRVPTDDAYRMRAEALAAAVAADRARGFVPIAVVATVGTTATTSIDPLPQIAELCRGEGIWLHVDAAYGGIAAIVPEMRHVLDGVELADSMVVNPHKWLFTPIDCSALYVRDAASLTRAFSLVPDYLATSERDTINLMDYSMQLGRRFRALKLWMTIRAFGAEGLASRIRAHCDMARDFAEWVRCAPGWELLAPTPFSTVCFRYAPDGADGAAANALNERILDTVNASGEVFLSSTRLRGVVALRLAVGNLRTERRHVERAWTLLRGAAASCD